MAIAARGCRGSCFEHDARYGGFGQQNVDCMWFFGPLVARPQALLQSSSQSSARPPLRSRGALLCTSQPRYFRLFGRLWGERGGRPRGNEKRFQFKRRARRAAARQRKALPCQAASAAGGREAMKSASNSSGVRGGRPRGKEKRFQFQRRARRAAARQ